MRTRRRHIPAIALVIALAGCSTANPSGSERPSSVEPASTSPSEGPEPFPIETFAALGDEPVSAELAAALKEELDKSANGDGLTATLITPQGTWSGATGMATKERAMVPNDQMSIGSITKPLSLRR